MLEICGMRSTPLLLSLPDPLLSGVVELDGVRSMGLVELNSVLTLN